ncbi:endonuclease/exonuclease/phosphatase family protein [Persicirhabdus sediminis]|uniref:Endonuclease/exonuclease/phosphatase family protein n=1 Tax=Persicirhabdus sediminis TaxID=454144 RepID=A0A8J7MBS1_9BACT|nr:endonuclease/exonuclease/phosphatase family protein [Persicirhabdus sediminis]MBK1790689.1 endonuclease/exonuclease/phosphatase family protein [Persicirhabdus sediminis]
MKIILLLLFMSTLCHANKAEFSILQFNIWNEAHRVKDGIDHIATAIIESDADIIAFSEVRNKKGDWHEKIIQKLAESGKTYHGKFGGGDVGLISRFPIIKTEVVFDKTKIDRGSIIAYHLELTNKQELVVCSAHLDWKYYGLNLVRGYNGGTPKFKLIDKDKDGVPDYELDVDKIISYNQSSYKGPAIKAFCDYAKSPQLKGKSIILAGDFNDGSHLDWIESTKDLYGHGGLVIPWKNSQKLKSNGFIDAYRELYPDPVTHPGITWPSPAYEQKPTTWTPLSDERDRIDYIYYRKLNLQAKDAFIVGPQESYQFNKLIKNTGQDQFICDEIHWPSDHKGVLVKFSFQ